MKKKLIAFREYLRLLEDKKTNKRPDDFYDIRLFINKEAFPMNEVWVHELYKSYMGMPSKKRRFISMIFIDLLILDCK